MKGRANELAAKAAAEGVEGMAEFIAGGLEADGDLEAAEALRASSDAFEEAVGFAINAVACTGDVSKGARIGAALGGLATLPFGGGGALPGGVLGGALSATFSSSCHDAVRGLFETGEAVERAVSTIVEATCPGDAVEMADADACELHCVAQFPGWCVGALPCPALPWSVTGQGSPRACTPTVYPQHLSGRHTAAPPASAVTQPATGNCPAVASAALLAGLLATPLPPSPSTPDPLQLHLVPRERQVLHVQALLQQL